MTRAEIEAQLRLDNPTTTDDSGERFASGSEFYEAAIQRWADAMEAQDVALSRTVARDAIAAQWLTLPAWIRGPFGATYTAAVSLLEAGDDEAAAALIEYADPSASYDAAQLAEFLATRADLLAMVNALPKA